MKCDECKIREATYHKVRNINGKITEKHLCEHCRKKLGEEFEGINFSNEVRNFFDDEIFGGEEKVLNSFFKSPFKHFGLLGSDLNEEFEKDFDYIPLIFDEDEKEYVKDDKNEEIYEKIAKLKQEQSLAVELENFEKAAKIKKKIEKLKKEVK